MDNFIRPRPLSRTTMERARPGAAVASAPREASTITAPPTPSTYHRRHKLRLSKGRIILIVGTIIVVLSVAAGGALGFVRYRDGTNLNDPKVVEARLSKHMILPHEDPIIITVTDTSKIDTPFLKIAQDGDKVIVFPKAARVIIYRPSIDRIVDVGPVNLAPTPSK